MYHKIRGIVVKESPHGESGKLLTVLAGADGVITVKAQGARKITASYLKSVQLFAYSEMLLYVKNSFYTLTEAILIDDFYAVREDITDFALASYCCEASASVATKSDDNELVLDHLIRSLHVIKKHLLPAKQVKAVFETRLLSILGLAPEVSCCMECGRQFTGQAVKLDILSGGFVCAGCSSGGERDVSRSFYDAFRFILSSSDSKCFSFGLSDTHLDELYKVCEAFFIERLEHEVKSLKFLKGLLE